MDLQPMTTRPCRHSTLSFKKGASFCMLSICRAFEFLPLYNKTFRSPCKTACFTRSRESNLDSCRPMSLGSYHPANLLIRTDSKQSLENRNGSRSEVCLSNRLRLCSLCALAHPSFLSLYLRMRSRGADPTVYPLDIRRSMAISLNTS